MKLTPTTTLLSSLLLATGVVSQSQNQPLQLSNVTASHEKPLDQSTLAFTLNDPNYSSGTPAKCNTTWTSETNYPPRDIPCSNPTYSFSLADPSAGGPVHVRGFNLTLTRIAGVDAYSEKGWTEFDQSAGKGWECRDGSGSVVKCVESEAVVKVNV